MKDLLRNIDEERTIQVDLRRKMIDVLRNATPGYLVKKRDYYYWRKKQDDEYVEEYLGTDDHEKVNLLKRKRYLQKMLKIIDKNIMAIDKFMKSYKRYDPESVAASMAKAYEIPPDSIYAFMELKNPKLWVKNYTKSDRYPEHLTQITNKGELVRSKSEVIIANALYANNIPYRYENVTPVGPTWYSPDFKILLTKDDRVIVWEHFGYSKDPDYLDKAMHKIKAYIDNGYVLWDNFIITFEDKDGNLDSRIVYRIIETCLL